VGQVPDLPRLRLSTPPRKWCLTPFPPVNADKIYTCFKMAPWPTPFNNWAQTFHNLVHTEHMRKVGTAEFAINSLGGKGEKGEKGPDDISLAANERITAWEE
jgi:hypothetical protein